MNLLGLSDVIFRDLSEPTDINIPNICFWLQNNLGKLNILIDSCYVNCNGNASPELGDDEAAIYQQLYNLNYIDRQIQKNLGAAAYGSAIIEIKEGNRTARKISKNDIAKTWIAARKDQKELIDELVFAYRFNAADPLVIKGAAQVPGGGLGYGGFGNDLYYLGPYYRSFSVLYGY